MSRFRLPRRRPGDKTNEEIERDRRAAAYQRALRAAQESPVLAEMAGGLPDDPRAAAERLRAVQASLAERAGPAIMGEVREATYDALIGKAD